MPGGGPYTPWEKCCFLVGITLMVVCCVLFAPITLVGQWIAKRFDRR